MAEIHDLGTFRLVVGAPGTSRITDPGYLCVEAPKPNPFDRQTKVRFEIRARQHVRATIYDIAGREICTLLDDVMPAGLREVAWDGTSGTRDLPSGIYFIKIDTRVKSSSRKLLVIR